VTLRRTKIIATLGPASDDFDKLEQLITAGVDLIRVNMSHGDLKQHEHSVHLVRQIAKKHSLNVGVLVDLQGPKVRISSFVSNKVVLRKGDKFVLDPSILPGAGDKTKVGLDYYQLANDVKPEDILLLDDGRLTLQVENIVDDVVHTRVVVGGELSNHKGINLKGGGISAATLTEKDIQDIIFAKEIEADYIAVSFVRNAQDIIQTKELAGDDTIGIIAKIERKEALENIHDIINCADAIMVARGDLGVEIGFAEVPGVQKDLIHHARELNKSVITATQMMESMIDNQIPTRAEVSDVANAVLDGTDAVMLSAETAVGKYPHKVIAAVNAVCLAAESQVIAKTSHYRIESTFSRVDEAIAMATMYTANHYKINAIVSLTETGTTPLLMSRIRSEIPIYGISRYKRSRGKMTLYRGVYPVDFDVTKHERWQVIREILTTLREQNILKSGDQVMITRGDIIGVSGRSNAMKIVTVE